MFHEDFLADKYPYVFLKQLFKNQVDIDRVDERDYPEEDLRELIYVELFSSSRINCSREEFWRLVNKNLKNAIYIFERDFTIQKAVDMYFFDKCDFAAIGHHFGKDFILYEIKTFMPDKHNILQFLRKTGHPMKNNTDYGRILFLSSLSKIQNDLRENREEVIEYIFELEGGE